MTACYFLTMDDFPEMSVIRRKILNDFTYHEEVYNTTNCKQAPATGTWEKKRRPIVGDHIHLGMVLSVNSHVYNFHDRNMSQPIAYEDDNYPVTCPIRVSFLTRNGGITLVYTRIAMETSYTSTRGPLPVELRVEGRDVRLKLWFESVGIEVSPDKTALKLPGKSTGTSGRWNITSM